MEFDVRPYPEQFTVSPDLLHVAIPRREVLLAMDVRGDEEALEDLWISVAVVADVIGLAQQRIH